VQLPEELSLNALINNQREHLNISNRKWTAKNRRDSPTQALIVLRHQPVSKGDIGPTSAEPFIAIFFLAFFRVELCRISGDLVEATFEQVKVPKRAIRRTEYPGT
jgi:hypothetical protein